MKTTKITKKILNKLYRPAPDTHKGDNGRLLIIAGSEKYHGSLVLSAVTAAKIVDFVYVHTTKDNFSIIKNMRETLAEFIYINEKDLKETIVESDAILMGPGLALNRRSKKIVNYILKNFPDKKIILDAGALRLADVELLSKNCAITPHRGEFEAMFGLAPAPENAQKISLKYPMAIILKGPADYVCQHGVCVFNTTHNQGMTKGGTGDVLAGLLAALTAKNDIWTAVQAAIYTNGLAGNNLRKKWGFTYSAGDLIPEIQRILR